MMNAENTQKDFSTPGVVGNQDPPGGCGDHVVGVRFPFHAAVVLADVLVLDAGASGD